MKIKQLIIDTKKTPGYPTKEDLDSYYESKDKRQSLWGPLPTITDYIDLDELNDHDEIEDIILQTTKKQGW